jgi:hypothetical protein
LNESSVGRSMILLMRASSMKPGVSTKPFVIFSLLLSHCSLSTLGQFEGSPFHSDESSNARHSRQAQKARR